MMNKLKTIAIIPARGGSKGIRHKNLKLLVGKPLINYTVEACIDTPEIDSVYVSTDSREIKEALNCFPEVSIIDRPEELATDNITSEEVLLHSIHYLENKGIDFDIILFAQATSPLSESSDYSQLINKITEGFDSAAFYIEDYGFFFDENSILEPRLPRQLRKPRLRETGNGWAFLKNGFLKNKCRTFGNVGLCELLAPKNIEIDDENDLLVAERLLQKKERKKRGLYWMSRNIDSHDNSENFEANYWGTVIDPDGKERNRKFEKEQRISDLKEELNYINQLPTGKILDIGCGMGDLLAGVKNDWEKHGLEVSKLAAEEASQYGNIFIGDLKNAPYESEYFDLVVMHHVIEHLARPDEYIMIVADILKPLGKLIIATPDFDGALARRYGGKYRLLHDKTHISLFSRTTLRQFLEDYGFEIEYESFPFFETRHFTKENLLRLFRTDQVSPPFWGNFMTFYCIKK